MNNTFVVLLKIHEFVMLCHEHLNEPTINHKRIFQTWHECHSKKKRLRITFMKIQAVNAKVKSYKKMFHFWKSKLWMLRSTHILHRCFCIWWLSDNLSLFKLDWVTHKCNIWYLDVIFTWNLVSNGIFLDLFRSMPYY